MQILILGMHRSGTSMVTRLVNMMGAYVGAEGKTIGFSPGNPKGFWERRDVNQINDALLRQNGCTWNRLVSWPEGGLPPAAPEQDRAIRSLILEMDAHRPWVTKDPRLCLTLPYWQPHLEVPVAVVAFRNPREIAYSLLRRDGTPLPVGLAMWEYHAVNLLNASLKIPRVFVRYGMAVNYPVRFVKQLYKVLTEHFDVRGLHLPSDQEIRAFVDKRLHRERTAEIAVPLELTPFQEMLTKVLTQAMPQEGTLSVSAASVMAMRDYCSRRNPV